MPQPQRRHLRFDAIDDAVAEAERLVAAERAGQIERVGNWTLGQSLGHLATWASFAFDGYPDSVRAPWFVRAILRVMRKRILTQGMMSGVRIRGVEGGTLGLETLDAEEALCRYRAAMLRLRDDVPSIVNPVFGKLTHEQWMQLNLRHSELHMSFLVPWEAGAT